MVFGVILTLDEDLAVTKLGNRLLAILERAEAILSSNGPLLGSLEVGHIVCLECSVVVSVFEWN